MSRGAKISIMGLYNNDPTVFDLMNYPDGFTSTQQSIFKNNVLAECAEFEILYPRPSVMKNMIGIWSAKMKPYWDRIYTAAQLQYDPIENYHRTESETIEDSRTEEHSGNDSTSRTGTETTVVDETSKETNSGSDSQTMSSTGSETGSGNDVTTNSVTGFDSGVLVDHDKSDIAYGKVTDTETEGESEQTFGHVVDMDHDSRDTLTLNTTQTLTHGESIEHGGTSERTLESYGNIGTMTSQDMLTQEVEVAKIIQVIPIMIQDFMDRFCLTVY